MHDFDLPNAVKLLTAAIEVSEDGPSDLAISFQCPVCGGDAAVMKSSYNGHHHVHCDGCGLRVME